MRALCDKNFRGVEVLCIACAYERVGKQSTAAHCCPANRCGDVGGRALVPSAGGWRPLAPGHIVRLGRLGGLSHAVYLFELLRWIGAAYLIWLGVQTWRNAGRSAPIPTGKHVHFWRGFLVALSNPKTIAFFTAFLPQFVDPARPAAHQIAVMCVVSALLAGLSDSCWAIASGLGRAWFMKPARAKLLGRASGLTLIGGGMWLSLARRPA